MPAAPDHPSAPRRDFRLREVAVFVPLVVLVALLVFEGAVRIGAAAGVVTTSLRFRIQGTAVPMLYDPVLGWCNAPGAHDWPRGGEWVRPLVVHQDALGLRATGRDDPDAYRILFLGDSMTWGWGVADDETFPALLEARLGPAVDVVNGAVPGYATDQESLWLDRFGERVAPDAVVVMVFANDLDEVGADRAHGVFRPYFDFSTGGDPLRGVPVPLPAAGEGERAGIIPRAALLRSAAYRWMLSRSTSTAAGRSILSAFGLATIRPAGEVQTTDDPRAAQVARLIERIGARSDALGARVLFAFLPRPRAIGRAYWDAGREREVVRLVEGSGRPVLRVDLAFRERGVTRGEICLGADGAGGHYNPAGHELVAAILSDELTRRRWVPE